MTDEQKCLEWLKHRRDNMPMAGAKRMFGIAISALEKQEKDRWHSVAKEGNPKKSGLYIVTDNSKMDGGNPHTRYFNAYGDKAFWSGWGADEVIAWRPLPKPYKEDKA